MRFSKGRDRPEVQPRAILHIGTEKTGTTSIQRFFGSNRRRLMRAGILYPRSAADRYHNHTRLTAYAAEDGRYDDLRRALGVSNHPELERFRTSFRAALARETERRASGVHTIVFSNEHCHSRLVSKAEVSRLVELLRPLVSDIKIVVYLRRQDQMAVSLYSTHLKLGGTRSEIFPSRTTEASLYYNLEQLLNRWEVVCGADRIEPRIYEPGALKDGDVVSDFLKIVDFARKKGVTEPVRVNESFSPDAQAVVREINQRMKLGRTGLGSVLRRQIINIIVARTPGRGRLPDRETAMAFYRMFEASNERVRRKWFPQRETLFDEDFTVYPSADDIYTLSRTDTVEAEDDVMASFGAGERGRDR